MEGSRSSKQKGTRGSQKGMQWPDAANVQGSMRETAVAVDASTIGVAKDDARGGDQRTRGGEDENHAKDQD